MNEIVTKFLLAEKQPGFTYSACVPFTKNKERIQKFKETGDTNYIYNNELDKAYFQYDMAYRDFKDLKRRSASDNVLTDKAFNIAKHPKYDGYQRGLASMVYKFFDKTSAGSGVNMQVEPVQRMYANNEELAEEIHKPIIRKLKKGQFIQDLKIIFGVLI